MNIPEWVMILLVSGILTVLGWGVMRLVSAYDATSAALVKIGVQLAGVNGRLEKSEQWMTLHQERDEASFTTIAEAQKELWHAINLRRE